MLNLNERTLEGTLPTTSVGICARMAWVSMGRLLVATKGLPPAREVCPLRVRWMDAGAPGERSNQHGEPRRSLEGLDCLGMLPATPATMLPACGTWRVPSADRKSAVEGKRVSMR